MRAPRLASGPVSAAPPAPSRSGRQRSLLLKTSVLCATFWAASSLGCDGKDSTQVNPGQQGNQGGASGNTTSGVAGGSATSGSGGQPSGAAGQSNGDPDAGSRPCVGNPSVSFVEALAICGGDCLVCAVDIVEHQPIGYFTLFGDDCSCASPAPRNDSDAGRSEPPLSCTPRGGFLTAEQAQLHCAAGADAGACRVCPEDDAATTPARSWSVVRADCECPTPLGNECGSQPNLTEAEATALCTGLTDCHVCVQQTDPAGAAEIWLAHACGCPEPYRRRE